MKSFLVFLFVCATLYRGDLKNWEFGKEGPENFCSERATIADWQGASENENSQVNLTKPKTNFSNHFGICNGNVLAMRTEPRSENLLHVDEADEDLEKNENSSLISSLLEFTAKGGTLIRLERNTEPFSFFPGDQIFPSCSGGNNRSQTLLEIFHPYAALLELHLPHATRYGFDPYNGLVNWHRTHHKQKDDEFILWCGRAKSPKLGWSTFESFLSKTEATPEELQTILDYYTTNYYDPEIPSGSRRIYITFAKNAHAHLYRLNQTNASLENAIVLFYPLEDCIAHPLPEWETYPRSVKCYTEFSKLLRQYLDFSLFQDDMDCSKRYVY
jgi:hypothetical protein